MKKENLDREALLLLKALVETQNLVRAAQSLDMPAATASRTLARLRDLFGDTLFTRCAGGLTPTARALELAAKAQAVLSDMDKLLEPAVFDPASLKRSFRIACVDHGVFFVAPAAAQTARLAPGVELEIVEFANNWASDLQNGELDFAISPVDEIPADCMSLTLEHCRSVLLMKDLGLVPSQESVFYGDLKPAEARSLGIRAAEMLDSSTDKCFWFPCSLDVDRMRTCVGYKHFVYEDPDGYGFL